MAGKNQKLISPGETVAAVVETWEAKAIKREADRKGISVSALLRQVVRDHVKGGSPRPSEARDKEPK